VTGEANQSWRNGIKDISNLKFEISDLKLFEISHLKFSI